MKRIAPILCALLLLLGCTGIGALAAQPEVPYVCDTVPLLTDGAWEELNLQAEQIAAEYQCAVYFVTVEDYTEYGSGSIYQVAKDIYRDNDLGWGSDRDGIMLLLSMDGRDSALIAYGYGNTAFTDYGKEYLEKEFLDDFADDDWEHGCRDYLTTCADLLKQARSGQPLDRGARVSAVQALLVSLVLGFLLAWVICWIWKTIAAKKVAQASQAQAYLTRELYDRMNRMNHLYQQGYTQLYGETGELVDDAAAIAYLEDNEYISANHILLMTVDSATGEALDEETVAAQEKKAKEIAAELQAIDDPQLLLARFAELKEEYCEDTGKVSYPDGYTFTPGTMVTEFEDTCNALEDYQVSDPVLTSYGYHVIIRLPLDPDRIVEYSNEGTPLTARSLAANAEYASRMDAQYEKTSFEYVPGFSFSIKDFLK